MEANHLEMRHWLRIVDSYYSDIHSYVFSIPKIDSSKTRSCYLNCCVSFCGDDTDESVRIKIGDETYDVPTDGKIHSYFNIVLPTRTMIFLNTTGISKPCALLINLYSIF